MNDDPWGPLAGQSMRLWPETLGLPAGPTKMGKRRQRKMKAKLIPERELTEDADVSASVINRGVLDLGDLDDEDTDGQIEVDLIPSQMWGLNCRSELTQRQWQYVSDYVRFRAGWSCEFCGRPTRAKSKFWMIAHERFVYDEEAMVMRLDSIISICPRCNDVAHPGNATLRGRSIHDIAAHYADVAGLGLADATVNMKAATEDFNRRSSLGDFSLDISLIDPWVDLIEGHQKRSR